MTMRYWPVFMCNIGIWFVRIVCVSGRACLFQTQFFLLMRIIEDYLDVDRTSAPIWLRTARAQPSNIEGN